MAEQLEEEPPVSPAYSRMPSSVQCLLGHELQSIFGIVGPAQRWVEESIKGLYTMAPTKSFYKCKSSGLGFSEILTRAHMALVRKTERSLLTGT